MVFSQPNEYLSIPINGEPVITKNYTPVDQPWCKNLMIKDMLNCLGDWRKVNDYNSGQKPAFYELYALKNAFNEYISEYKYKCGGRYVDSIGGIGLL